MIEFTLIIWHIMSNYCVGPMKSQPAAYLTLGSRKKLITRSGDFSSMVMCSLAASRSLALVLTGVMVC